MGVELFIREFCILHSISAYRQLGKVKVFFTSPPTDVCPSPPLPSFRHSSECGRKQSYNLVADVLYSVL